MIYCFKSCDKCCVKCRGCCDKGCQRFCRLLDKPLAYYVLLAVTVNVPSIMCAALGSYLATTPGEAQCCAQPAQNTTAVDHFAAPGVQVAVSNCKEPFPSMLVLGAADAALGIAHIGFAMYFQWRLVSGLNATPEPEEDGDANVAPKAPDNRSQEAKMIEQALGIMSYDVGFLTYMAILFGSLGWNALGVVATGGCVSISKGALAGAAYLQLFFAGMLVVFVLMWFCILRCVECNCICWRQHKHHKRHRGMSRGMSRVVLGNVGQWQQPPWQPQGPPGANMGQGQQPPWGPAGSQQPAGATYGAYPQGQVGGCPPGGTQQYQQAPGQFQPQQGPGGYPAGPYPPGGFPVQPGAYPPGGFAVSPGGCAGGYPGPQQIPPGNYPPGQIPPGNYPPGTVVNVYRVKKNHKESDDSARCPCLPGRRKTRQRSLDTE